MYYYKYITVYIARITILNIVLNFSIGRRYYSSYVLSNTKKTSSIVELGALAISKSVFFGPRVPAFTYSLE
jgi:hypothetical protein